MKKTWSFILIGAFITIIFSGCEKTKEQQFGEAILHQQNERSDLAIPIYRKLANSGYAPAQFTLAIHYIAARREEEKYGRGKDCDAIIIKLMQKAADQNFAPALAQLGDAFYRGDYGVQKNLEKAKEYHYKAAQQNYAPSMYSLAYFLSDGKEALSWDKKAREIKKLQQVALWPERYKRMEEEQKREQKQAASDAGIN